MSSDGNVDLTECVGGEGERFAYSSGEVAFPVDSVSDMEGSGEFRHQSFGDGSVLVRNKE